MGRILNIYIKQSKYIIIIIKKNKKTTTKISREKRKGVLQRLYSKTFVSRKECNKCRNCLEKDV